VSNQTVWPAVTSLAIQYIELAERENAVCMLRITNATVVVSMSVDPTAEDSPETADWQPSTPYTADETIVLSGSDGRFFKLEITANTGAVTLHMAKRRV